VTSIRGVYQRFRSLIHEGSKFLLVGGLGTVVTIGGAVALNSMDKYLAITLATIVGAVVTFLGNRYWAFRHRQGRGTAHESLMFFLLNAVGLLIYYACIWILQDILGLGGRIWYAVALLLGTGLGTVFRFWSYRKWVWVARQHHGESQHHREMRAGFPERLDLAIVSGPLSHLPAGPTTVVGRSAAHRAPGRGAPAATTQAAGPAMVRTRPGAHRRT
jgi:putative flippase GtrA